ncbi:MAG: hypothetical protein WCT47_08790 [Betaproteobacteria bacterium]
MALDSADIQTLSSAQVGALTTAQIRAIDVADVAAIDTADLAALDSGQWRAFTTAQIDALTTAQISTITTADLSSLTTSQLAGFAQSADIVALTSVQIQALTTAQISSLTTGQITWLETQDIQALTTAQIPGFSTAQIVALTTDQIKALETADILALSTAQHLAFETADIAVMSTDQINALLFVTPIVLDLDGNGVRTTSAQDGVNFDVSGVGTASKTGWVSRGDGLLVMDRNGDGLINDGKELFGAATVLANGQRAGDGAAALAEQDTNHDGKITAADVNFDKLKVWVDANHDGKTDPGELRGLVDLGIIELNVSFDKSDRVDNGNLVGMVSSYKTSDGQVHEMADVWFKKGESEKQEAPPLKDLLVDRGPELPATSAGTSGEPPKASPNPASGVLEPFIATPHRRWSDDDPKHEGLLI